MELALALLLYPGLLFTLIVALAFGLLSDRRMGVPARPDLAAFGSTEGLSAIMSALLAALSLALLPWPLHPAATWSWVGNPLALWAALEGAFLLPAFVGLLAPAPFAVRAASRETQLSVAGRCVVWLAVGAALWGPAQWTPVLLPGRVLLLLAGLLAYPAAAGVGPFAAERSLSAAGVEEGLDETTTRLLRSVRTLRAAVLLVALIGASIARAPIQPITGLLLIGAVFVVAALLLQQIAAALPRFTLAGALRWCWWRTLPLAVVGLIYLHIVH